MDEQDSNGSGNASLMEVVDARLSRRDLLRVGMGTAGAAVLGAFSPAQAAQRAGHAPVSLGFRAVAKSLADAVAVPPGYTASVLYATGDPLSSATPEYRNDGTDTGFDDRAGDHHDGIVYFPLDATRGILALNHEGITDHFLHARGATGNPRPAGEVDKEIAAHGLSFVEIGNAQGRFAYRKDSRYNRRVTPLTPVTLSGPVRGNRLVKTRYSPAGSAARGTLNNCGASSTPWGTFLSGEENWNGYFARAAGDDAVRSHGAGARSVAALARYGMQAGPASWNGWETGGTADRYARWNVSQSGASSDGSDDYRNEMNTFGWLVEVDPRDRSQAIRKRTALGRFFHEMGVFGRPVAGTPLAVYMGDDARGEYVYKFVSAAPWSEADAAPANRMAAGDKYLDRGQLYVARFDADGTGAWIALDIANPAIAGFTGYRFADQADVLVHARLAADAVGATKMDRPEWSAVHPVTGELYVTLTNNSSRRVQPASASQQGLDAANPRSYVDAGKAGAAPGNVNGHIVRLREDGDDSAATRFRWDIYLFGAAAGMDTARLNLSGLTADNDFSSPDGLWFSKKTGLLFIETDDSAYTDTSNCMLLVARPGQVGDGTTQVLEYASADGGTLAVTTRVGAQPTTDKLRRFMVGPRGCEITGLAETPDGRALFVNIQHPGESIRREHIGEPSKYASHWPGNAGYGAGGAMARPRSATIVITREDGGLIAAEGT